jgi:hypothetical protein
METTDLINFDEVCKPKLSVPTYFMMEQELFETKRKLSLLEERMIRLEEKLGNLELEEKFDKMELEEKMNKIKEQQTHIIPFRLPKGLSMKGRNADYSIIDDYIWDFCDINSNHIKIDMFHMYFNNCKLFELIEIDINDNYISFLKKFKHIKVLEIDLLTISSLKCREPSVRCREPCNLNFNFLFYCGRTISYTPRGFSYRCISIEDYKLLLETLLNLYKEIDIIFKLPILSSSEYKPFEEIFINSTNYKKLHMNFMNEGRQLPPPPSYVNETKEHCIRNNIDFTSNIGL